MSDRDERLLTGYTGRVLVLTTFGWAVVQLGVFLLPPLLPTIISDLSITPFMAGVALSAMNGVFALAQYPSGRLSDGLSRYTLIVPGLILGAFGAVLIAGSYVYYAFVVGAVLFGIGRGIYAVPSRVLLSDLFVERRGRAFGVITAATDLGGFLAAGIAIATLAVATWRAPFVPIAVLLLLSALLLHHLNNEAYVLKTVPLDIRQTGRRLLFQPTLRWIVAVYALFWFAIISVLNFLPTFLQVAKGLSPELASGGFALLFLVGMVTKPTAGVLSDRFGRISVATGGIVLGAVALGTIVATVSSVAIAGGIVCLAVGYKSVIPVTDALLMDTAPDATKGADLGAIKTVAQGMGSLGPAYVGFVAERLSYTAAFVGLVACLLAGTVILLHLSRSFDIGS